MPNLGGGSRGAAGEERRGTRRAGVNDVRAAGLTVARSSQDAARRTQLAGRSSVRLGHYSPVDPAIRIASFICHCSKTLISALAHCAPLDATAGTPIPAVVESPHRYSPGSGVVTSGNLRPSLLPAAMAGP